MNNSRMKNLLTYCKMTLLFIVLSGVVLFVAGRPLIHYVASYGSMIITKGAPGYMDSGDLIKPIMPGSKAVAQNSETTDQINIVTPALNTQYGTINCDRIALKAPLYYGDNNYSLENGAGQYTQSALPGEGKPILIGGHDGTFFKPLEKIKKGDIVAIQTINGKYSYKVIDDKIADQKDTTAYNLQQDKEMLILYTCYPFGQLIGDRHNRFFVYCDLISDAADNKADGGIR